MTEVSTTHFLQCQNLTKIYHAGETDLTVLDNLNLTMEEQEFVSITGESGSGKSTLLHLLGCLDSPTEGDIFFRGTNIASLHSSQQNTLRNRSFGFVFQFHYLLPEFSALENVILPGMIAGISQDELYQRGEELLTDLKLEHRKNHKPSRLSGGEQQRVAVARALINQPDILFMDEPTGNLDPERSQELIDLIRLQQKQKQLAIVMVTHNLEIARTADRHFKLHHGKLLHS